MVLSNKKLKQKLREKLAESLISSVAGKDTNVDVSGERDTESPRKSLKELLGTASGHGPRLSKREKRRESLILTDVSGNDVKGQVEETHYNIGSEFNENLATKVYVGGIPYYSTEDDICSFFESCGTITEIDCMKFPESGKFRGIAILSFKTEAAAKRALACDGADMGGLFLKVQPYKGTRKNRAADFSPGLVEGYNRIYMGNLSWDVTEDDLKKLFSNCKIGSIRFGMDKETGEFRGYAHVDFSDSISLKTALKLDQEIIHGRPVKIRCAVPKKGTEKGGGGAAAVAREEMHPEMNLEPMPETKEAQAAESVVNSVSGKIRRRTCYECGEKGHLSSNCPNKQPADSVTS
ncbi:RNA-binding protein CP31B [Cucumis melo var. makuwa]|uniref:RNA-binding protein CP31B n=1 Tax=Cucumis melo var. makuwa TaxID=1194695 RepID=A0A5A7U7X8_CUCMM|nr:RNA-binding protein CP31B [Cucumis melo var. makuwa]